MKRLRFVLCLSLIMFVAANLSAAAEEWKEFYCADSLFSVAMPDREEVHNELPIYTHFIDSTVLERFRLTANLKSEDPVLGLNAAYLTVPKAYLSSTDPEYLAKLIDEHFNASQSHNSVKTLKKSGKNTDKYLFREIKAFEEDRKLYMVFHYYLVGDTLCQLQAYLRREDADVRKFFDSFKLVNKRN